MIARMMRAVKGFMLKRVHGMITCAEFEDFILSYLDGELPQKQRSIFELHLRICRECRDYLAAYRRAMELGRAVFDGPDMPVPKDVPEDLIVAILAARNR